LSILRIVSRNVRSSSGVAPRVWRARIEALAWPSAQALNSSRNRKRHGPRRLVAEGVFSSFLHTGVEVIKGRHKSLLIDLPREIGSSFVRRRSPMIVTMRLVTKTFRCASGSA
jgi:hypothetical protein